MGINQLPFFASSQKIKFVFSTIVILIVLIVISIFVHNRIKLKHIAPPLAPQKTNATLSIQNFRHTSSQDGQVKWSIEASAAHLYAKENIAELSDISATFFLNPDKTILLTADQGVLRVDTNNMTLTGDIVVRFSDYVATTESLNYVHKSRMIKSTSPVKIAGDTMTLKAETMTYDLDTGIMKCSGGVTGTFQQITEK